MARILEPKRGEVYVVDFDPAVGAEIKKTRPAVVLQNNVANKYGVVTIVAAITSFRGDRFYPTKIKVVEGEAGLDKDSAVMLNQLRTVDKTRLGKKLGMLDADTMGKVDLALQISLGLVE